MSLLVKAHTPLNFKVRRGISELVTPAKPTPYEFKQLSDVESLGHIKGHVPVLAMYSHVPYKNGVDPVKAIRKGIAEALVLYYPLAGRLRKGPSGKLILECTGEGVLFTEADANVTLDQFDYPIVPPVPCSDQLLFAVPDSRPILNSPLVLFQVTRLKCGGFVFGIRINNTMADGAGIAQFMQAIGELARGETSPSVLPVWERHILHLTMIPKNLPPPPSESDKGDDIEFKLQCDLCHRAFILRPAEILALKRHVPPHLRNCTSYEIITAAVWKCRIIAFQPDPSKWTRLSWSMNMRRKLKLPIGYYGKAIMYQTTEKLTAKEIKEKPLSYIVRLIQNGKEKNTTMDDCFRNFINMEINTISYIASDSRYIGYEKADFGWGEAVYAGPDYLSPEAGDLLLYKNKNGESGIMLAMTLPKEIMEIFEKELANMLKDQPFSKDEDVVQSKL